MDHPTPTPQTRFFWEVAEPLLTDPAVSIGTLMRFPCLRAEGNFFATCDHRTGDLIVKLPRHRVIQLIAAWPRSPTATRTPGVACSPRPAATPARRPLDDRGRGP